MRLSVIRFLLEAGFLVLVAAAAGLAGLSALWIGVVMFGAWLLVALVERTGSRRAREVRDDPAEEARPEAEPRAVEPQAAEPEPEQQPEPEPEPALVALPEPEPLPRPEAAAPPEPEPAVVPFVLRDSTPRMWNLWELERLAAAKADGDPAREQERTLLLLHMRQFADPAGDLPVEFDALVREAFGADLAELVT
jgi:outer membrane biosynthesis protein TonB